MKILTVVPIYRNLFQKPTLFFSVCDFSVGSIIFIPFPVKEKPALIIQTNNLKEKKLFIRKNKIKIGKVKNPTELFLCKKETIKIIQFVSQKTNLSLNEILQKIISKKIIREINQLTPEKHNLKNIQKFVKKLTPASINKKILGDLASQSEKPEKYKGVQTIKSVLSAPKTKKTSLYSEKHYLVDEIRNYFGENAKKGVGSFGFYLGFFGKIPKAIIYQYWSEAKQSRQSIKNQQKLFWWKVGQFTKTKSEKRNLPAGRQELKTTTKNNNY